MYAVTDLYSRKERLNSVPWVVEAQILEGMIENGEVYLHLNTGLATEWLCVFAVVFVCVCV